MDFFGENHDPTHSFAANKRFVDWQYYMPDAGEYNILIAKGDSGMLGVLAYIPNTFFDSEMLPERKFIWTTNWLVKRGYKGFVGLDLLYSLPKHENCENIGTVGQTAASGMFYQKIGYRIGKLEHYFFVNENVGNFKVLSGYNWSCADTPQADAERGSLLLKPINSLIGLDSPLILEYLRNAEPCKSPAFFENKYVKNPFYKYYIYGIISEGKAAAAMVCRVANHNGANVVRLVEYIGRAEYLADSRLQDILDEHNAEYMDFYCAGVPHDMLCQAGFMQNTGEQGLIVPNYFEPFQNSNIEIAYAYKFPECCIFKGDGDRDHPR